MPNDTKRCMLVVRTNVSKDGEDLFNSWYSGVHLPDIVKVPGVRWGRRYRLAESSVYPPPQGLQRYIAIYDLDNIEVLQSAEFLKTRGWSPEVKEHVRDTEVSVYELMAECHAGEKK